MENAEWGGRNVQVRMSNDERSVSTSHWSLATNHQSRLTGHRFPSPSLHGAPSEQPPQRRVERLVGPAQLVVNL